MKKYIPSITGVRALSILIVIFHHLRQVGTFGTFEIIYPFNFLLDGNFGVNVFFVISGFLITTLLLEEEKSTGTISLKDFYIRRVFRIFPAYYFILFVYFILQLYAILYFSRPSWLSSIFYYKYLVITDPESVHFWSLSVEEQFYLAWPLIFLLFKRARVYFAGGIILLVFACRFGAYYNFRNIQIIKDWSFIFQRVDAIMIGCLFAMYQGPINRWIDKAIRSWLLLPIILFLLFLNSPYFVDINQNSKLHLGFLLVPLAAGTPIGLISNVLIGMTLVFFIRKRNFWYNFLNWPVINYIGKLSYSLYLWQQLFIFSHRIGVFSVFPLNLVCILIAALFSYYIIELPFLRLKSRFEFGRRKGKTLTVSNA
jgi:peptidoglycan/LPS O-acetylase OafA/YrhL